MSKMFRLAQFLELKYGLQSEAAASIFPVNQVRIFADAQQDILHAFKHYLMPRVGPAPGSRNPSVGVIRLMSEAGDPDLADLTYKFDMLVASMDQLTVRMFSKKINEIADLMLAIKNTPERNRQVRNNIRLSFRGFSPHTVESALKSYETSMSRIYDLLKKAAKKLHILDPNLTIPKGELPDQRMDLTPDQIIRFMQSTPYFRSAGLDTPEVVQKIMEDPELKELMTTVINAERRGFISKDYATMLQVATDIRKRLEEKNRTNLPFLEREKPAPPILFPEQGTEDLGPGMDPQKLQEFIHRRNEEHEQRLREKRERIKEYEKEKEKEEEELLNKYNSLSFEEWMRK
jgi:hypothetical protein